MSIDQGPYPPEGIRDYTKIASNLILGGAAMGAIGALGVSGYDAIFDSNLKWENGFVTGALLNGLFISYFVHVSSNTKDNRIASGAALAWGKWD